MKDVRRIFFVSWPPTLAFPFREQASASFQRPVLPKILKPEMDTHADPFHPLCKQLPVRTGTGVIFSQYL